MTTQTMHGADAKLRRAIADELDWSPEVNAVEIGVSVNEGVVTLSGEVATYPERQAAIKAALRVRGVLGVADEIVVRHRFGPREDIDIARDAAQVIGSSVQLHASDVKATVHDGRVTLRGTVHWNYQREEATRVVSNVPGVKSVYNALVLRPKLSFTATDAKQRITDALVRNAQTDAKAIHVAIDGTEVTLTGTVRSWPEHQQAGCAAWATPGVTEVHNGLKVGF